MSNTVTHMLSFQDLSSQPTVTGTYYSTPSGVTAYKTSSYNSTEALNSEWGRQWLLITLPHLSWTGVANQKYCLSFLACMCPSSTIIVTVTARTSLSRIGKCILISCIIAWRCCTTATTRRWRRCITASHITYISSVLSGCHKKIQRKQRCFARLNPNSVISKSVNDLNNKGLLESQA